MMYIIYTVYNILYNLFYRCGIYMDIHREGLEVLAILQHGPPVCQEGLCVERRAPLALHLSHLAGLDQPCLHTGLQHHALAAVDLPLLAGEDAIVVPQTRRLEALESPPTCAA